MKLLHFGLFDKREPQQSLRDALKGISKTYWEYSFIGRGGRNATQDFLKLMKRKPDVVFMQIQQPNIITGKVLKFFRNTKFFNFSGDVRPDIPEWYFDVAPYVTTLFTNTDWVDVMSAKKFKAQYFQIGFDHNIYKPTGPKEMTKPVVFIANNHGGFPLSKLRCELVERFKNKPWFQVYGVGWGDDVINLNGKQQDEAAIYRGAKIGINLSQMDLSSYTSDRMFRMMGSGAMCLAYKHKDIEKEFTDEQHVAYWSDLDELERLIEFYLHDSSTSVIASNGCNLVHSSYTWPERMKQLKEMLL